MLRDYSRPVWDDDKGQVVRILGVAQDITTYIYIVTRIQTTARRLQTMLDTIEDGITLSDEHGYFEIFNARMEAITGYSKAEANACDNFLRLLYPNEEDYHRALFELREIQQGGVKRDVETTICAKDGARKTLLVSTSLFHDQERDWFLSAYHDITGRRGMQTQLLLLQNAINTTRVGVTITATDKTILYLNSAQAEMLGYAPKELMGQNARLLAPETYWRDVPFEHLNSGWERETVNLRKDGSAFPVYAVSTPVYDDMGEPVGVITITEDMTARKEMETQLRAALREKEILLHELHHRIKNNMQSIASMIRLLYDRIEGEQNIEHLCECEHRIQAMALIHELLYHTEDVARLDMQKYLKQLTCMMVSTYDGCRNSINVQIEIEEVFLELETAIACGLLVHELVSNSLKYAFPDGKTGELLLSLLPISPFEVDADKMFELIVCDNGIGLPEDFDPRQSESLGFTLVMGWINQLQADLRIERDAGTCFRIRFRELSYEKTHTNSHC